MNITARNRVSPQYSVRYSKSPSRQSIRKNRTLLRFSASKVTPKGLDAINRQVEVKQGRAYAVRRFLANLGLPIIIAGTIVYALASVFSFDLVGRLDGTPESKSLAPQFVAFALTALASLWLNKRKVTALVPRLKDKLADAKLYRSVFLNPMVATSLISSGIAVFISKLTGLYLNAMAPVVGFVGHTAFFVFFAFILNTAAKRLKQFHYNGGLVHIAGNHFNRDPKQITLSGQMNSRNFELNVDILENTWALEVSSDSSPGMSNPHRVTGSVTSELTEKYIEKILRENTRDLFRGEHPMADYSSAYVPYIASTGIALRTIFSKNG